MTGPGTRVFALQVGLGPVPATLDDVRDAIGGRLDAFEPALRRDDGGFRLSLLVAASDLWLAVLSAMAAVSDTGYPVVELHARPAPRSAPRPADAGR